MNAQSKIEVPPPPVAKAPPPPPPPASPDWFNARVFKCSEVMAKVAGSKKPVITSLELWIYIAPIDKSYSNLSDESLVYIPIDKLASFAAKVGYKGSLDSETLAGDQSPLIGFEFEVLATGIIHTNVFIHLADDTTYMDYRPAETMSLSAHQAIASFDAMVGGHSAVYIETAASSPARADGWCMIGLDFQQRAHFFAGKQTNPNGSRSKKMTGLGKRTSTIIPIQNQIYPVLIYHFAVFQTAPGIQLMYPIWKGASFWEHPQTDADVAHIITACTQQAPPT